MKKNQNILSKLFYPKSIALIGASRNPVKLGYDILSNLRNLGYHGKIFPVNPETDSILGLKVYPDITSLPCIPDLTVIAIPAPYVNSVVSECGKKGIKNIVIITAGFKEIGAEGVEREKVLQKIIEKYGIQLIGPNCLGIINRDIYMNASFAEGMPEKGNVSLISQSGAMAVAIIDWAYQSGLGFSKIISMGNKAGISENTLLEYLENDPKTKVILMYLESIVDGKEFLKITRRISMKKPIIVIKSGTSEAGTRAISSHTGSLAGSDTVVSTAFRQSGIIRAEIAQELFDYAKAFSYEKPPQGNNVAVITNAGGPGIMTADALAQTDLVLSSISPATKKLLAEGLPSTAALDNPIDVIGDAPADRYRHAMQILLEDPKAHSLIVVLTPQVMTQVRRVAMIVTALSQQYENKTVLSVFMGGENIERAKKIFHRHRFPNYPFPERAVQSLQKMVQYREWKAKEKRNALKKEKIRFHVSSTCKAKLDAIFHKKKKTARQLNYSEMDLLLTSYGIHKPKRLLARNADEVCKYAEAIGYPIVMKISSKDIYHKTDVGGIRIDIQSAEQAKEAYSDIIRAIKKHKPNAKIDGVTLESMLSFGKEVIIGCKYDEQFGHFLMFGLGGIYVEILKDVVFCIAPVSFDEALAMIEEVKTIKILKGVRGEKAIDLKGIADIIVRVSRMVTDYPEIREFEINPLIVGEKCGPIAVDTKCII